MREITVGKNTIVVEGRELTCKYFILVEETGGRFPCESYGIKILLDAQKESAEIHDISLSVERINDLAELLCRNSVTPVALRDVVEDWL